MKYAATLLVVRDMERARKFYCDVLGLKVTADFGANITLDKRLSLQTLDTWKEFINKDKTEIAFKNNCSEIYFETEDIDKLTKKLKSHPEIEYVHGLIEASWGQRSIRFYDPDGNMIEVGEDMHSVVKRFRDSGMTVEETAKRMDVPVSYIESMK